MPTCVVVLAAPLHSEAWRALLDGQPEILVVGLAGEASEVPALLSPSQPGAVLVDFPLPLPELGRQLRAASRGAGLLFLVPSYDIAELLPLFHAGVTGCLAREASVGDLARALIAVGRGELVLPPAIATQVLVALARGEPTLPDPAPSLSEREREVLRLLAQGLTNKDIAQTLILSVRTVEAHLRNVFARLGVRTRTEAAVWAVRHGYGAEK